MTTFRKSNNGRTKMKIKVKNLSYEQVLALPKPPHILPKRPGLFFRALVRAAAQPDLSATHFTFEKHRMEPAEGKPCLILMNHSSFLDLEIVSRIFFPKPYCIVCTSDGFVGKPGLMRNLGCIPTQKFVSDVSLIHDIQYAIRDLRTSVLMYPEASYTFDGTATPLPRKLGILLKKLEAPVVMIKTEGAFTRDPLYNCLQKRKVDVHADVTCLLTPEEIREKSVRELDAVLDEAFTFDHFAWQREKGVRIPEPFRADGLNRILYRCPVCGREGCMEGSGETLTCHACGKAWHMDELGQLEAESGESVFTHIPDWYRWERQQVRQELENGSYQLDTPVRIGVLRDYKSIYMVGTGRLQHSTDGFTLTGCGGALEYHQSPLANYGLYADYYWYELGDIICIGSGDLLYYCFPEQKDVVAKTRMAAEELYKLKKEAQKTRLRSE